MDSQDIFLALAIGVLAVCLVMFGYAAGTIDNRNIVSDCQAFGSFLIDDQIYSCEKMEKNSK